MRHGEQCRKPFVSKGMHKNCVTTANKAKVRKSDFGCAASKEEALMSEQICALKKIYGEDEVLLVFNISNEQASIDLSGVSTMKKSGAELEVGGVLLSGAEDIQVNGTEITLPPYTVIVFK